MSMSRRWAASKQPSQAWALVRVLRPALLVDELGDDVAADPCGLKTVPALLSQIDGSESAVQCELQHVLKAFGHDRKALQAMRSVVAKGGGQSEC